MKRILWLNKEMFQKSQENPCLIFSLISDALTMPSENLQISLQSPNTIASFVVKETQAPPSSQVSSQYFLHTVTLKPETALAFVSEIHVFSASELRTKRETYPTIVIDFRWSECLLPLLFFWEREKMRPWNAFSKPHVSLWASYFVWIPCLRVLPVLSLVSSLFSLWGWQKGQLPHPAFLFAPGQGWLCDVPLDDASSLLKPLHRLIVTLGFCLLQHSLHLHFPSVPDTVPGSE